MIVKPSFYEVRLARSESRDVVSGPHLRASSATRPGARRAPTPRDPVREAVPCDGTPTDCAIEPPARRPESPDANTRTGSPF